MNSTQLEKYEKIDKFLTENRFVVAWTDNEIHHYWNSRECDFNIAYNIEDNEINCFVVKDLIFSLSYDELTVTTLCEKLIEHGYNAHLD